MPNILAMSFEGDLAPSFDLRCLEPGRKLPDGWGIGYYPGGEPSACILKEPAPNEGSIRSELVKAWQHLESSLFLVHVRTAMWGMQSDANTQPFLRSWGGRDWMVAHAGSLYERLPQDPRALFEPVGSTDTEQIFCGLLNFMSDSKWRSLAEADLGALHRWFDALNDKGVLTLVFTDGHDLCVYADREGAQPLYMWQLLPPEECMVFGDGDLQVDLARRGVKSRKGVVVSSNALSPAPTGRTTWERVPPGKLMVFRQGAFWAELDPLPMRERVPGPQLQLPGAEHPAAPLQSFSIAPPNSPAPGLVPPAEAPPPQERRRARRHPAAAEVKRLSVSHRTAYRYTGTVERSEHLLRLTPFHDELQTRLKSEIRLSVDGRSQDYDDVFGNRVRHVLLERPYSELIIEGTSEVELTDVNPINFGALRTRSSIPLVWMPWQRHMLQPYLLPPELPESQLKELIEYAQSFVKRNDYDLLETLLDINASIYEEYEYKQGITTLATTAFDVYSSRRGVCQDFTNLYICLARLLGVPARYVCGYLYTGEKATNQAQAAASHAWVQVYLPDTGWRGFDPTNGVLTQTDHVRVAVGRSYGDAAPTTGTIWVGGGTETLEVEVRVKRLDQGD